MSRMTGGPPEVTGRGRAFWGITGRAGLSCTDSGPAVTNIVCLRLSGLFWVYTMQTGERMESGATIRSVIQPCGFGVGVLASRWLINARDVRSSLEMMDVLVILELFVGDEPIMLPRR